MSAGSEPDVQSEIGHVLFIDIVGYSKLLINEQSQQIQTLKEIVRATEQFRLAEAEGKLLRLPTGDGGALVFRNSPEAPVLCALEISKALKSHPELHVRMGIHSGPVNEITDLNEQANIAGAGINIAQRVMDCGDAWHILLSKHVAEDLEHYARWRPLLHDLGECEVKHGAKISVVNLYTEDAGNSQMPEKFSKQKQRPGQLAGSAGGQIFRRPVLVTGIAVSVALLVAGAFFFYRGTASKRSAAPTPAQRIGGEKSVAVLPFVDLSQAHVRNIFVMASAKKFSTRSRRSKDCA